MKKLTLYVDSRCSKTGNSAFCVVAKTNISSDAVIVTGTSVDATSMGAELLAAKEALEYARANFMPGRTFTIVFDSSYVFKGITQWLANWEANDWKGSDNKPVKNVDIWKRFHALSKLFNITWELVSSKHDHPMFVLANQVTADSLDLMEVVPAVEPAHVTEQVDAEAVEHEPN